MMPELRHEQGLSISLSNDAATQQWVPVTITLGTPDRRHRISFRSEKFMSEVFCPEITEFLEPILAGFTSGDAVYSNPDAVIRLPGLIMRQVRVIYSSFGRKNAHAQVRFSVVSGNPHRTLLDDDGFAYPMEEMTSQVYREALNWVLLPALNIAALTEDDLRSEEDVRTLTDSLAQLRASRDQLLFQVELVKRELGRLERRVYAKTHKANATFAEAAPSRPLLAAEPKQEDFATMKVLRKLD